MTFRELFSRYRLGGLRLKLPFLEAEVRLEDTDRAAAWDMYIELITRITTQALDEEDGDEKAALTSVYSLFPSTREVLKRHGTGCYNFARIAVVVLNQVVRPFTAKWHKRSLAGAFEDPEQARVFRAELAALQPQLAGYAAMLAEMAGVEDITDIEEA